MTATLLFALTLFTAVLLSGLAQRSILSTAVLFLAAGFTAAATDLVHVEPASGSVRLLVELALFAVLFTDGMRTGLDELRSAWRLPGRALVLGMPLTVAGTALLCRLLLGFDWPRSLLIGAALAPTDPVFSAAIVGRQEVPSRLRHLLNVESGVNDGLALPLVLALLALVEHDGVDLGTLGVELAAGVGIGVAVPMVSIALERSRFFGAAAAYQPLHGFAIGALVWALTSALDANPFLAAFAAGVTIATRGEEVRQSFHGFGEACAELLKLAAVLVLGLMLTLEADRTVPRSWTSWLFAVLVLVAVRPAAIGVALLGGRIASREWVAAAWFGPKGFASVAYALLILGSGASDARDLYDVIAVVLTLSIVVHSTTDYLVVRWFARRDAGPDVAEPGRSDQST